MKDYLQELRQRQETEEEKAKKKDDDDDDDNSGDAQVIDGVMSKEDVEKEHK